MTVGGTTTEPITSVIHKFCVDSKITESVLALGFIPDSAGYDTLTDKELNSCLEERLQESQDSVTLETLEKRVRMAMHLKNACCMEDVFMSYQRILCTNLIA